MISSRVSYVYFVALAYNFLSTGVVDHLSAPIILSNLYQGATNLRPPGVPAKNALGGPALYQTMANYIAAPQGHYVAMQTVPPPWRDITGELTGFADYYTNRANGIFVQPDPEADLATQRYLHVYPIEQAPAKWRIGLNVLPSDMDDAMADLTALLNNYDCIGHMKFMSPGNAGKADSAIVYCDQGGDDYQQLEQAVLNVAANLNRQPCVSAMWEEIQPGIGLASEPPMEIKGLSFTDYRCIIVYLAYWQYSHRVEPGDRQFQDFNAYLDGAMWIFGVDTHRPFEQGPLQRRFKYFDQWWRAFARLGRAWRGARIVTDR
jgi:hypothetical protein